MGWACGLNREMKKEWRIVMGKPPNKYPLVKSRVGWGDQIKMDLRKICY
jgi:hypothetical protein